MVWLWLIGFGFSCWLGGVAYGVADERSQRERLFAAYFLCALGATCFAYLLTFPNPSP